MTIHARAVPCPYKIIFFHIRRHQERLGHWRPHFFGDDVGEGKLLQGAALASLQPRDLQRMRTGHKCYLLRFAITAAAFRSRADKELGAVPLRFVFTAIERQLELVHVRRQTLGRRYLRHRAMKRCMPTRIISRMARAAGVRTHVIRDS